MPDRPLWLVAVPVALAALAAGWWIERRNGRPFRVSDGPLVFSVLRPLPLRFLSRLCEFAGVALLAFALAWPGHTSVREIRTRRGMDLVVVVDRSSSMAAEDFGRSRLAIARSEVAKLVARREGDRIGVVAFAAHAYLRCPLTEDHDLAMRLLDRVDLALRPEEDGTAIGDALAAALRMFPDEPGRRAIVLLTDGVNTAGTLAPGEAAQMAKALGVRIHTVGIGTDQPVPYPVQGADGRIEHQMRLIPWDPEGLRGLAEVTDGRSATAQGTSELRNALAAVDQDEAPVYTVRRDEERHHWEARFAVAGIALAGSSLVLRRTWRRGP